MRAARRLAPIAATLVLATFLWACADDTPPPVVAMVQIDPDALELEVGTTAALSASAFDESGRRISGRATSWESRDPSVATVDRKGEVQGLAVGEAKITATIDGKRGSTRIKVTPAVVARVEITPARGRLLFDETLQLGASAFSSRGEPIDGRAVSWESDDPEIASVTAGGVVRGRRTGTARITALIDGIEGTATIDVAPPISVIRVVPERIVLVEGESTAFAATLVGKDGTLVEDRELAWSSGDPEVAIADSSGFVKALRVGKAAIYAEGEGVVGMATVEVEARPASLRIEPPSLLLQIGMTTGLSAIVMDTAGAERPATGCTWISTAPAVIRAFDDGAVQTVAEGEALLEAKCLGLRASIEAKVLPRASLRILGPGQIPMDMDGSIGLEAVMGEARPQGSVDWIVAQPDPFFTPVPAEIEGEGASATLGGLPFDPDSDPPMLPALVWVSVRAEGRSASRPFVAVPSFVELQAGPYHTCGTAASERLCWGDSRILLPQGHRAIPVPWAHPMQWGLNRSIRVVRTSPGETNSYGVTAAGSLVSWGCDRDCDTHGGSDIRVEVELSEGPAFLDVAAGYGIRRPGPGAPSYRAGPACGLVEGGRIHCWNLARSPAPFDAAAFVPVEARREAATAQVFSSVGVGAAFVCALTPEGEAWCWGPGGIDAEDGRSFLPGAGAALPAPLDGAPPFVRMSVGKYHACGLTSAGEAWCWGHSREGALGAGFSGSSETPVRVAGGLAFQGIDASIEHSCGLTVGGEVYCWGRGESSPKAAPVEGTFGAVVAGALHACALPIEGGIPVCWGDNSRFQLGRIDSW
ncbi:MAG TPA: Ig-like domain-containing protein [Vulgatibacter sp.]